MSTPLLLLAALAAPGDELLLSAFSSDSFHRFEATSGLHLGDYGPAPMAGILGATTGPDGHVYVCSEATNEVLRFDGATGTLIDAFIADDPATPGDESGGLAGPAGIVFGPDGHAYVASFNSDEVLRYDGLDGSFQGVFVSAGDGLLNGPDAGLSFGPGGDLFVPSFWTNRIKRYDPMGVYIGNFLGPVDGLSRPRAIYFPGDGSAYVTSEGDHKVFQCDELTGDVQQLLIWNDPATPGDETGGLNAPTGIRLGPDGALYVASLGTDSVKRYDFATGAYIDDFVPPGAAGNDAPTFLIFRPGIQKDCGGAPNSTGTFARLTAEGFTSLAAQDFRLQSQGLPLGQHGLFFYGPGTMHAPFGDGFLCVSGPHYRLPVSAVDAAGIAERAVNFGSLPTGGEITAGSSWAFQFWYRDPTGPLGTGFNTSDALLATFGA